MICYKKYLPLFDMDSPKYDTFALTGGRGSWKTGSACRAVLVAMMKKKKRVVCFRETKSSQKSSLINEFQELIDNEFKGRGFVYNTESVTNVITGSTITFHGLRDSNANAREAVKGLAQVDIWLVDEGQAVSLAVWEVLLKTIRKDGARLIAVYNRIDDDLPIEKALFLNYAEMTAPEKTYFVEVNYPELAEKGLIAQRFLDYAELVKKNKPDEYERDYLNKPRGANVARVVKYWSKDNVNPDIRYCDDLDIYLSMDFNVDPMMWVCIHRDSQTRRSYVFDEIVIENCCTDDAVNEFISRYRGHKAKVILNGDASGQYRKTQSRYTDYAIVKNALLRAGFKVEIRIRRHNPPIQNRVKAFNNMVFGDDGQRRLLVSPVCEKLIYNMKSLVYKPGTSVFDLPTPDKIRADGENKLKFLGHIFDAVSYHAEFYEPILMRRNNE